MLGGGSSLTATLIRVSGKERLYEYKVSTLNLKS